MLQVCPFSLKKAVLLPAIHSIFEEAVADGDFEFLEEKWLSICVKDLNFEFWVSFKDEALVLSEPDASVRADVSFSASAEDLMLIAGRKQDPDTLFFQRKLLIEGDTELGLAVKNLIDSIDLDNLPSLIHQGVEQIAGVIESTRTEQKLLHGTRVAVE